jgi:hypothetical protein
MRIRMRGDRDAPRRSVTRRRRAAGAGPLEQAEAAMAAIRRAEEAAAARLAAEKADRADVDAARRRAAELLAKASRRAAELAAQRRQAVRAACDAEIEREHTAGAAEVTRIRRAAQDRHELGVELAVTLVLTGEAARCSFR